MTTVADAIRNVTSSMQATIDSGLRSRTIDADDLIEVLLSIADQLDPPVPSRNSAESELLAAARLLLDAKDEQMETCVEWERIRNAVAVLSG